MMRGIAGSLLSTGALLMALATLAQTPQDLARARAEEWLGLVDQGKYGESWGEASKLFRGAVTKDKWKETVTGVRAPLGKLASRKIKSRQYAESLPGAPDGKYVVIQYDTTFENKKAAVETITSMLDTDGLWRVSGYFIK
jgi:hypothetical protein